MPLCSTNGLTLYSEAMKTASSPSDSVNSESTFGVSIAFKISELILFSEA